MRLSPNESRWCGWAAAASALLATAVMHPAFAQHTGMAVGHAAPPSHASAPAHAAAPARSFPSGTAPRGGMTTNMHTAPTRPGAMPARTMPSRIVPPRAGGSPTGVTPDHGHHGYRDHDGHWHGGRDQYQRSPAYGVGYVGLPYYGFTGVTGYLGDDDPVGLGFDDADDQQSAQAAPGPDGQQAPYPDGYGAPDPPPYGQPPYDGPEPPSARPPYVPGAGAAAPVHAQRNDRGPVTNGLDHPQVTLVFNDGRPPKKVQSYVLTGSSVFVAENGRQIEIPVSTLDLQATVAQNRQDGVDFALPGGTR